MPTRVSNIHRSTEIVWEAQGRSRRSDSSVLDKRSLTNNQRSVLVLAFCEILEPAIRRS